jgi:aryl sulfotransferase
LTSDSARWDGFAFRPGDIVISTPPKCGTTWTQMLCALLIFMGPEFPEPLDLMSPWIDMPHRTIEEVRSELSQQEHRRFLKTHTPLDGLPLRDDVTYLVVGRDPRDVAISFHHHRTNMDLGLFLGQRAATMGLDDLDDLPPRPPAFDDPAETFRHFSTATDPAAPPSNLCNLLHHLDTGWQHRHDNNVSLFHYADYAADLPGELRRLATILGIELSDAQAGELAEEAGLDRMRKRADRLAPGASHGHWPEPQSFFRTGGAGEWREGVTVDDLAAYDALVASLVSPQLAAWAHHGRLRSGIDPAAC